MGRFSERFRGLEDVRELFGAYHSLKNPALSVRSLGSSTRHVVDVHCQQGQVTPQMRTGPVWLGHRC